MISGATGRNGAERRGRGDGRGPGPRGVLACALMLVLTLSPSSRAVAADFPLDAQATAPYGGVACSIGQPFWVPLKATAETLPWPSVYLGHFSGGRPYLVPDGRTLVDWRDEYVCFPSSAQCRAWVRDSYRAYHRPEGYRTCLFLR